MKILYIHQYFNTPKMPGSTRSYEFAKRLVQRGDTVYMVSSNWQKKSNLSYSLISGIHVYWAPLHYNNEMSYFKRLFIFIRFIGYVFSLGKKLNFDLIIASSTPLTIAIPAILLKRLKKVKLVFEIRDLWPQIPIAIGAIKSKFFIKLAKWLEKITYANSNHIICLSSGMSSELSLKIPQNKITVVTNLSDVFRFQNFHKNKINLKIPINKERQVILYTGSFGRINGLTYLVEIANNMKTINPNIFFLLVGNGYDRDNIIIKSKEYGIYNKSLFYIDYLPKDQIPELLSLATIAVSLFIDLPEMKNNSANKFFDALAAGKPIMINYNGWQADLINETGCGFVISPNNSIAAAEKINNVIKDKDLLIQMSNASRDLSSQFDIETNYKKFQGVIDSVGII